MSINNKEMLFIYSEMQVSQEKKINEKMGKRFECGEVSVGAFTKKYSMLTTENEIKKVTALYPDTKIVARGQLSKMTYTDIKKG